MAGRPRTICVIDDEERAVRAFARLTRSASMNTVELNCVQDLLEIKTLDPESCVVADIRMPGESELTIPALLAECGSTLPVIFVTAVEDEETRLEAERVGAAAFLRKPVGHNELPTAIFGGMGHRLPVPAFGSGSGN